MRFIFFITLLLIATLTSAAPVNRIFLQFVGKHGLIGSLDLYPLSPSCVKVRTFTY